MSVVKRFLAPGLALAVVGSMAGMMPSHAAASADEPTMGAAIAGGEVVKSLADSPGAVALFGARGNFVCSASRIGPQWVLTARHCVEAGIGSVMTDSLSRQTGQKTAVAKAYNAPSGDVALLKLASTPPGKIMKYSRTTPASGSDVRIYGWGRTCNNCDASPVLKTARGAVYANARNPFYGGTDINIRGVDGLAWKGDSGGPVVKDGLVQGAASWSSGYGRPTGTCGYGSVGAVSAWVQNTTGIAPGN